MKKSILFIFFFIIGSSSFTQCVENTEKKVLLIGDSWAFFMNADGTFNNVMDHWGMTNAEYLSNPVLAVNGARTEDFLIDSRKTEIQNQLEDHPSIKVVHISLSGNDFLGDWNVDFTPEETTALSDETFDEIVELTNFIKSLRPGIRIVFSGYMYANFAEVINDAAPFETSHPFYGNWEDMGFPTFEELNSLLNDFSERIYNLTLLDPQLDFINVPALMQYHFGQASPLGVDPGGTYPALYQPLPYGDLTYPSPKVAMRDYGITRDCFHLSVEGYYIMIDYQFQKLYHKLLMDDAYFLATSISENGSVSSDAIVSSDLKMGEESGEEFITILSFNTTTMAETTIESASIYLRRASLVGGNPIDATLTLRMESGYLGSSLDVDLDDYSDEGDISAEACVFGSSAEDSDWIRIDLPTSFLPLISNGAYTQFSILAEDALGEAIIFTGGDDPDFAPVLNLKYTSNFASVTERLNDDNNLNLYPNPGQDQLYISTNSQEIIRFDVFDLQGKSVKTVIGATNSIRIEDLTPGQYILKMTTASGVVVKQFQKS